MLNLQRLSMMTGAKTLMIFMIMRHRCIVILEAKSVAEGQDMIPPRLCVFYTIHLSNTQKC